MRKTRGEKHDPLTYHFLLAELAKDSGENIWRRIDLKKLPNRGLRGVHVKGIHGTYKGNIYVLKGTAFRKGARKVYTTEQGVDLPIDITFHSIWKYELKDASEFSKWAEVKDVGTYKDCLGGGWYSNVPMYKYKDKYYALIECSDYMDGEYWKQSGLSQYKKP